MIRTEGNSLRAFGEIRIEELIDMSLPEAIDMNRLISNSGGQETGNSLASN